MRVVHKCGRGNVIRAVHDRRPCVGGIAECSRASSPRLSTVWTTLFSSSSSSRHPPPPHRPHNPNRIQATAAVATTASSSNKFAIHRDLPVRSAATVRMTIRGARLDTRSSVFLHHRRWFVLEDEGRGRRFGSGRSDANR